jgi:amino acid permease
VFTSMVVLGKGAIYIKDNKGVQPTVQAFGSGANLVKPIGLIIFAFGFHLQAPQIFAECADPDPEKRLKKSESMENLLPFNSTHVTTPEEMDASVQRRAGVMFWAITGTLLMSFVFQSLCGLFGYFQFGDEVEGNVLNSFSSDDNLVNVLRLGMMGVVSVTYPIVHNTGRLILHDLTPFFVTFKSGETLSPTAIVWVKCFSFKFVFDPALRNTRMSTLKLAVLTLAYWVSTLALALIVTEVEYVFAIIGSSAGKSSSDAFFKIDFAPI